MVGLRVETDFLESASNNFSASQNFSNRDSSPHLVPQHSLEHITTMSKISHRHL